MGDINFIKELNLIPCGVPEWWVIAETGFQAAAPALLTIFTPGCTDIVKTKVGLSPWHHRGVKALLKGAQAPFAKEGKEFLWKIGYFELEKYLYWFMIADVTKEFFMTWQTLVFQQQQCQLPGHGTAFGYPSTLLYNPGYEGGLGISPQHLVPGVATGLNNIRIQAGLEANVALDVIWDSYPIRGKGVSMTTWYTIDEDATIYDLTDTRNQQPQWANESVNHFFKRDPGAITAKQYKFFCANVGDTIAQVVGGSWNCSTMGRVTGNTSFGCTPKPVSWPFPNPLA
jgi:hypothetical protein